MNISFLHIGRIKSIECRELLAYYTRLTGKFAKVETIELTPNPSQDQALLRWLERKGPRVYLSILDERGKVFSSQEFAVQVEKIRDSSPTEWAIAVGSEHGYSEEVKRKAKLLWSLSPLTFPHELAAAIATEQVFRALSILHGHPYHNYK